MNILEDARKNWRRGRVLCFSNHFNELSNKRGLFYKVLELVLSDPEWGLIRPFTRQETSDLSYIYEIIAWLKTRESLTGRLKLFLSRIERTYRSVKETLKFRGGVGRKLKILFVWTWRYWKKESHKDRDEIGERHRALGCRIAYLLEDVAYSSCLKAEDRASFVELEWKIREQFISLLEDEFRI